MKMFIEMTEEELEKVDLVEFTGLKVGDRVRHKNAGKHGGNGTRISDQLGTVIAHQNQGLHHLGGLCVTVDVKWDDGSETRPVYSLLEKDKLFKIMQEVDHNGMSYSQLAAIATIFVRR